MDFLVLSPPVCTPAEPPSGAFLLAAGLAGHGFDTGLLDLSLEFFYRVFDDPRIPGPPTGSALSYLLQAQGGYDPMRHRSEVGVLHKRLRGFSTPYPGWKLTLMDIGFPGRQHNPARIKALLERERSPFQGLFEEVLCPVLARYRPRKVLVSLAYLSQLVAAIDLVRFLEDRGIDVVVGGSLPTSLASTGHGLGTLEAVFGNVKTGDGISLISDAAEERMLSRLDWPHLLNTRPYLSYRPIVPLALSTGCFWRRCLFCPDRSLSFYAVPQQTLARFLDNTPPSLSAQRPVFHLLDSALPPKRLRDFLPHAKAHQIDFYGFARPTRSLLKDNLLRDAAESGLIMLQLGVESGSKSLLDRFDKGLNPGEAERVIRSAADVGIRTYLYLLFGLPGESDSDREATLSLVVNNVRAIDFLNLSLFNLPRYCELADRADEFDIVKGDFARDDSIRLYWPFTSRNGSPRNDARHFLSKRFESHPRIHPAVLRTPRWLRAAHLALMRLESRRPV
ncbi:MAG: radical SAM protein [Proteobacteria bacterium]|nr:radical SAM protein [Pseudomonadota bacterium]